MKDMKEIVQIGLRVPESLNKKLSIMAKERGISKNSLVLVLIDNGLNFYKDIKGNHHQQ